MYFHCVQQTTGTGQKAGWGKQEGPHPMELVDHDKDMGFTHSFIEHLLCSKHFTDTISLNPHGNHTKSMSWQPHYG